MNRLASGKSARKPPLAPSSTLLLLFTRQRTPEDRRKGLSALDQYFVRETILKGYIDARKAVVAIFMVEKSDSKKSQFENVQIHTR